VVLERVARIMVDRLLQNYLPIYLTSRPDDKNLLGNEVSGSIKGRAEFFLTFWANTAFSKVRS
jgi:hypothetical protein